MRHLFPSNSGDTEQRAACAALGQRRFVQLGAIFTRIKTGEKTKKNQTNKPGKVSYSSETRRRRRLACLQLARLNLTNNYLHRGVKDELLWKSV